MDGGAKEVVGKALKTSYKSQLKSSHSLAFINLKLTENYLKFHSSSSSSFSLHLMASS